MKCSSCGCASTDYAFVSPSMNEAGNQIEPAVGETSGRCEVMAVTGGRVCIMSGVADILQAVRKGLPTVQITNIVIPVDATQPLEPSEQKKLLEAEVLLTDPALVRRYNLVYLPKLKWMQSTWAGVDSFISGLDKTKPFPSYRLTRAGSVFGPHMAEYVISHIIAQERRFPEMATDQQNKQWNTKKYAAYRLLSNLTLGILGLGEIGRDVAKAAKCFGMTVSGLGRQEGSPRAACEHIDQYRGPSRLAELLGECDYLCCVLPSTPATTGLLSGDVLSACKQKKPVLINIGRGNVISEASLLKAFREGWIGGAILDVFETEPLPADSQLWSHPAITITPHCAGISQAWQIQELFVDNYRRYVGGLPLRNLVQWELGY